MLGPFSVDAYLPAFPVIGAELKASAVEVQQTLSVYVLAFGAMMLWHGTLSDSLGRRPVIIVSLVVFVVASIGCCLANNIVQMIIYRALQGCSAGAGTVVGRAMIRDRFEGPLAQRMMSRVTMLFSIAPAFAPIVGGHLLDWLGWRSVFAGLVVYGIVLLISCFFWLPETLPHDQRQSLAPESLMQNYWKVFRRREFQLLAASAAFNFSGLFLYVASAPVLLLQHLKLGPRDFGILFIPVVAGIFLGSFTSGRVAGKISPRMTIAFGFGVMALAAAGNSLWNGFGMPEAPWAVLPLAAYTYGMALTMPNVTLLILDLYPEIRGLVSSFQSFTQVTLMAAVAGGLAPLLSSTPFTIALGNLALLICGGMFWGLYLRGTRVPAVST